MKKKIFFPVFIAAILFSLLAGCGGSGTQDVLTGYNTATAADAQDEGVVTEEYAEVAPAEAAPDETGTKYAELNQITGSGTGTSVIQESDKIIYSAYADIETLDFEASVEAVYDLIERYEGFLESSSVNGNNYFSGSYGNTSYRSASFSIRIPQENYKHVYDGLESLGNIPYKTSNAENISSQYIDTESRLASYRTQEERLLELLEQAKSVEDMITIESRLSEVRYQIESLTTTLRGWDSLINYSSVTLNINEVAEVTQQLSVPRSYWDEVSLALLDTLNGTGNFFKALFKYLIAALPLILILAAVAVIVLTIRRRRRKNTPVESARRNDNEGDDCN